MRVVVILALAALASLVLALTTGSTWPALAVIALALAGIVLLLLQWRSDRSGRAGVPPPPDGESAAGGGALSADDFSPDISTDPSGPSSDARAD